MATAVEESVEIANMQKKSSKACDDAESNRHQPLENILRWYCWSSLKICGSLYSFIHRIFAMALIDEHTTHSPFIALSHAPGAVCSLWIPVSSTFGILFAVAILSFTHHQEQRTIVTSDNKWTSTNKWKHDNRSGIRVPLTSSRRNRTTIYAFLIRACSIYVCKMSERSATSMPETMFNDVWEWCVVGIVCNMQSDELKWLSGCCVDKWPIR